MAMRKADHRTGIERHPFHLLQLFTPTVLGIESPPAEVSVSPNSTSCVQ